MGTGQYSNVPEFGLYYYNARWYDGQLGRFAQADTIIPLESQGVQAWDRYAGMNNNPLLYVDITGHDAGITPIILLGWDPSYMSKQPDHLSCAPTAIAAGISTLVGYKVDAPALNQAYKDAGVKLDSYVTTLPNGNPAGGMNAWAQAMAINSGSYAVEATDTYGTREDLINNLKNGYPTVVTVSWKNDPAFAHALLVVKYDPSSGEFTFFDPARGYEITENLFESYYVDTFNQAWLNQPKGLLVPPGSMVTLRHRPPPKTGIISPPGGSGGGGSLGKELFR